MGVSVNRRSAGARDRYMEVREGRRLLQSSIHWGSLEDQVESPVGSASSDPGSYGYIEFCSCITTIPGDVLVTLQIQFKVLVVTFET